MACKHGTKKKRGGQPGTVPRAAALPPIRSDHAIGTAPGRIGTTEHGLRYLADLRAAAAAVTGRITAVRQLSILP